MTTGHPHFISRQFLYGGRHLLSLLPCLWLHTEARRIVTAIAVYLLPFLISEVGGAEWEENVVLLIDHFCGTLQHGFCPCVPFLAAIILVDKPCHLVTYLIIHCPHDLGRSEDAVAHIQNRIEQVTLLGIVDGNRACCLNLLSQRHFPFEKVDQRVVLGIEGLQWMTVGGAHLLCPAGIILRSAHPFVMFLAEIR